MAGGLNWQGVAAPDLVSGSLQGLDMFTRLMNSAGNRVTSSIDGIESRGRERSQLELERRLAGMDHDQIKAGQLDGSLTGDLRHLKASDLAGIQNRAVQALAFAGDKLTYDGNVRTASQKQALDEATPILRQAWQLQRRGDNEGALKLMEGVDTTKMGFTNMGEALKFMETGGENFRTQRNSDQTFDITGKRETRDQTLFEDGQADRKDQRFALNWIREQENQGYDPQAISDRAVASRELTAGQKYFIAQQFATGGGLGGGAIGGAETGGTDALPGSGGSTSKDPLRVMNYEAVARGFTAVPDSVKTLGDAVAYGRSINVSNQARYGEPGSSAMGPYQVTRSTMERHARKLFGNQWNTASYSMENMDRIGQSIFEERRGSNSGMRNEWVALKKVSDGELNRLRAMPWDQARVVIGRLEGGVNLTGMTPGDQGQAIASNQRAAAGSTSMIYGQQLAAARAKPASEQRSASQIAKANASAPEHEGSYVRALQTVMRRAGVGAEEAAIMIENYGTSRADGGLSGVTNFFEKGDLLFRGGWINLGGGRYLADRDLDVAIAQRDRGTDVLAAGQAAQSTSDVAAIGTLVAQRQAIETQIQGLRDRASRSGTGDPERFATRIAALEIRRAALKAQEDQLQAGSLDAGRRVHSNSGTRPAPATTPVARNPVRAPAPLTSQDVNRWR